MQQSLGLGLNEFTMLSPAVLSSKTTKQVLFPNDEPGVIIDPYDAGSRFQETSETTAATTFGDPVGRAKDTSGNNNHLDVVGGDTTRPTYHKVGNLQFFRTDGGNDYLQSIFTMSQPIECVYALQTSGWTANDYIIGGGTTTAGLIQQFGSSAEFRLFDGAGSANFDPGLGKKFFMYARRNNASGIVGLNDDSNVTISSGASNITGVTIGAQRAGGNNTDTRVYGIILHQGLLSDDQVAFMREWARARQKDPAFDDLHTSGLIREYRFDEAAGAFCNPETGTGVLDLNAVSSQSAAFNDKGVLTTVGMVEISSVANVRTMAILHQSTTGQAAGYELSGGASATSGIQGNNHTSNYTVHVGQGRGVVEVAANADGSDAGLLNSGGYRVTFVEFDQAYSSIIGIGGRHSSTLSRVSNHQIVWAGAYGDVLTDAERTSIYNTMREVARARGVYIDYRDCPTIKNGVLMIGDSNMAASGALISELSAADQARIYGKVEIANNALEVSDGSFDTLVLGSNHVNGSSTLLGPEIPFANLYEDSDEARDLVISKTAEGSTFLAPSTDANVTAGSTFSTSEDKGTDGFYNGVLQNAYRQQADAMQNGVGVDWKGVVLTLGTNDATYTTAANTHEVQLEALISEARARLGIPDLKFVIVRTYITTPTNETGYQAVRAAQEAVADADENVVLIDADGVGMADSLHWSTAGTQSIMELAFAEIF